MHSESKIKAVKFCQLCGYSVAVNNYGHRQSKEHLRRKALEELEIECKKLEISADSLVLAHCLNRIDAILRKKVPNGNILLFHLGPRTWKNIRSVGPDEFRKKSLEDESKPKFENILGELEAYPALQTIINVLRMSKSDVRPPP